MNRHPLDQVRRDLRYYSGNDSLMLPKEVYQCMENALALLDAIYCPRCDGKRIVIDPNPPPFRSALVTCPDCGADP